ncbi:hypothetical protein ACHWQZ_G007233 [Mnemiopsis leidyi]
MADRKDTSGSNRVATNKSTVCTGLATNTATVCTLDLSSTTSLTYPSSPNRDLADSSCTPLRFSMGTGQCPLVVVYTLCPLEISLCPLVHSLCPLVPSVHFVSASVHFVSARDQFVSASVQYMSASA